MKLLKITIVCLILFTACKENKKTALEDKNTIQSEKAVSEKTEVITNVEVKTDENKPTDMVYFEGGTITIGSNERLQNEAPVFEMEIKPFYLDKNLITVAEFRNFINATDYKTDADKFGDSGVYSFDANKWSLLKGANWEFPLGKDQPKAIDNHPVTQVSWNDAKAYAGWVGKRLPTEFEWEFAAKGGKNKDDKYAWGNSVIMNGKYMANVWQGTTVNDKKVLDGYLLTSPIGVFGANKVGLTDMGGNVWQWCDSYFKPYPYNEKTPPAATNVRTTRGGSFMFDQALEDSYTVTFRGQNSIDTSLFNMGFRCAK